jgi:hypothetical protein
MANLLSNTAIGNTAPVIGLISESFTTNSNSVSLSYFINADQATVSVGGVIQLADIDYTISGATLTLSDSYIEIVPIEVKYLYSVEGLTATSTQAQGSISGYTSGGTSPVSNVIDKFPFSTDSNASDVGDLTQGRYGASGQSSTINGYTSGGTTPPYVNTIDKFPFSADANATDVGDLTQGVYSPAGQSSTVSGYISGGFVGTLTNVIDKFPFAIDGNASDVGDLTQARWGAAGQSSTVSGYISGGTPFPAAGFNTIDKFPFATDANATDVGDLTQVIRQAAGQSSTVSGYRSGGRDTAPLFSIIVNTIDRFPFATDANATDVGDLTRVGERVMGQSSINFGYVSGGLQPGLTVNTIDKFPFSSDGNASDVGDLTQARYNAAEQQV